MSRTAEHEPPLVRTMPTRRDNPLVSRPDPHLADGSPWRQRKRRRISRAAARFSSRPKGKLGFIAKTLGVLGLCTAVVFLLLAYGRPYTDAYVKPYLEKIRAGLHG